MPCRGRCAIDRRGFILGAATALLCARVGRAQPVGKAYRIGIISAGNNPRTAPFYVAFEQRLHELGWTDGGNLMVDFSVGETREPLADAAARFVGRSVDLILAVGPEAGVKAASGATKTIPIVIVALNYDPVEKGYVEGLARPGRNITGVFFRNPEVGAKQLELLHEAIPSAARVGVLWTNFSSDQLPPIEAAASRLRLQLEKVELASPYDIDRTFATLKARRVDAVLAVGDPVIYRERVRIADAALLRRLPVVGGLAYSDVGILIGFGPDLNNALRKGAEYVDKILRGAKPADLPIDQPTKFGLSINLKTAKALGLAIPQSLLLRADDVIQ
ncbi:MAG: ABC transporter substrate-binding protein [Betaproteobacteria bacterium]